LTNRMTVYLDKRSLEEEPNMTDEERAELEKQRQIEKGAKLLGKLFDYFVVKPFLILALLNFTGLTVWLGFAKITYVQSLGLVLVSKLLIDYKEKSDE